MALAVSEPVAEVSSGTDATSYATGSFTPTANSLLIAVVMATGTNAVGSFAGGSLTWTNRGTVLYSSGTCKGYLFTAPVGGSPSSMTGTFDCTGDGATGCDIMMFQVTGHNVSDPIRQFKWAEDEDEDVVDWTLDSALLTGNAYIAAVTMHGDRLGWDPGPTSGGWTVTAASGHNGPSVDSSGAYKIGGETGSSYAWQTGDVMDVAGVFVEINADGGSTFTATCAFALGGVDFAIASESDPPVYAAATAFALGGIDLAAIAEGPLYTATAAFALGGIELSAHVEPSTGAAAIDFQLGGITLAAAIDTGQVDNSAAADFQLGGISIEAEATYDPNSSVSATCAFQLGGIEFLIGANVWTAFRCDFMLGGIELAAGATLAEPSYTASCAFALGGIDFGITAESEHPQAGFCAEAGQVAAAGAIAGMVSGAGAFAGQVGC